MTRIKLIKTGGILGLIRSAEKDTNMDKDHIATALKNAAPTTNEQARDAENYVVYANDERYVIDPEKLQGSVKKLIDDLKGDLKPGKT